MFDTMVYTRNPTPTRYNGVLFRSYLESEWARHFDNIGVKWVYEPEVKRLGFSSYLPDFEIEIDWSECGTHNQIVFLEVKPSIEVWTNSFYQHRTTSLFSDQLHVKNTGMPHSKRMFVLCGYPKDALICFFDAKLYTSPISVFDDDDKHLYEFPILSFTHKVLHTIHKSLGYGVKLYKGGIIIGQIICNKACFDG